MTNKTSSRANLHVVIVDDDDMVLETVSDWFSLAGFDVTPASCLPSAMEALSAPRAVDVLVTDYNLAPGVTGVHLAREARKALHDLPIVIFTGNPAAVAEEAPVPGTLVLNKTTQLSSLVDEARALIARSSTADPAEA